MRILFIGGLFSEKQKQDVYRDSKNMPHVAANVHQWNIVNGLQDNVDIINPLFVGNYPREHKRVYLPREEWKHTDDSCNVSPPTINIFGIKQIARLFTLTNEIGRWIKRNQANSAIVVVYSMDTSFLVSLLLSQRLYGKVKTALIVPDLPVFYIHNAGKGRVYRMLKTLDWKLMKALAKRMDGFVLLTEQMKELLEFGKKPYLVSEGICTAQTNREPVCISEKTITYTGTLDREFGVLSLVENFQACAPEGWILHIAGGGNAQAEIAQMAESDRRICYHGVLTNEETKKLQRQSSVLVNPRSSDEEFTKYSFPSKTMEYLQAGRPVIMHHLAGIPQDYDPYLIYFADTSDQAVQQGLQSVMMKDANDLTRIGEAGKTFVEKHKNPSVQGEKMKRFLKSM